MTSPKSKMTVRPGSEMGARVTRIRYRAATQHFGAASVVPVMNDSMLTQATYRRAELTREAGQARLAARTRRPQPTPPATRPQPRATTHRRTPSRPPRPGSWLVTVIARLRPAARGRWLAQ